MKWGDMETEEKIFLPPFILTDECFRHSEVQSPTYVHFMNLGTKSFFREYRMDFIMITMIKMILQNS